MHSPRSYRNVHSNAPLRTRRSISSGNLSSLNSLRTEETRSTQDHLGSRSTRDNAANEGKKNWVTSIQEADERDPYQKVAELKQGAQQAEVYGFVGWISTLVAYALFFLWAMLPDKVLTGLGISYYPSRYWAIGLPAWIVTVIFLLIVIYNALNLMNTEPLDSFNTIKDEHSRQMTEPEVNSLENTDGIPEISDMDMRYVNRLLYPVGDVS